MEIRWQLINNKLLEYFRGLILFRIIVFFFYNHVIHKL